MFGLFKKSKKDYKRTIPKFNEMGFWIITAALLAMTSCAGTGPLDSNFGAIVPSSVLVQSDNPPISSQTLGKSILVIAPESLEWQATDLGSKIFLLFTNEDTAIQYHVTNIPEWLTVTPSTGFVDKLGQEITVSINDQNGIDNESSEAVMGVVSVSGASGMTTKSTQTSLSVKVVWAVIAVNVSTISCGPTKTTDSFQVWNSGKGMLKYNVSTNASWLKASPSSDVNTGQHDNITVTADRTGLPTGDYTGTITISSTQTGVQAKTVNATMNVAYPPAVNIPPVANAGPNQTITDSNGDGVEQVTLDGSASTDADGTITHYKWTEGTTVVYDGVSPTATVILGVGVHTLLLTVTDNDSATGSASMICTINPDGNVGSKSYNHFLKFYDIRYNHQTQSPYPSGLVEFTLEGAYAGLPCYSYYELASTTNWSYDINVFRRWVGVYNENDEYPIGVTMEEAAEIINRHGVIGNAPLFYQKSIEKIHAELIVTHPELFPHGNGLTYGVQLDEKGNVLYDSDIPIPDSPEVNYRNGLTIVYPVTYIHFFDSSEDNRMLYNFNSPAVREFTTRMVSFIAAKGNNAIFLDNMAGAVSLLYDRGGPPYHYISDTDDTIAQCDHYQNLVIGCLKEVKNRNPDIKIFCNGLVKYLYSARFYDKLILPENQNLVDGMMTENQWWGLTGITNDMIIFYQQWAKKLKALGKKWLVIASNPDFGNYDTPLQSNIWFLLHLLADTNTYYYMQSDKDHAIFHFPLGRALNDATQNGNIWTRDFERGRITFDTTSGRLDAISFEEK